MPDISILVDIADYYDISIPEIISGERKSEMMNEEERKIAKTMSDYATTEKEKIFKEMKLQSVMGVCALVLYWILHETGAYMYNDVLGKLAGYCETLVSVSVIMMAAFTTGSLSKVRSKSRKVFVFENFPKPMQLVVTAVVAFGGAAVIKLVLVYFFGLYVFSNSYYILWKKNFLIFSQMRDNMIIEKEPGSLFWHAVYGTGKAYCCLGLTESEK